MSLFDFFCLDVTQVQHDFCCNIPWQTTCISFQLSRFAQRRRKKVGVHPSGRLPSFSFGVVDHFSKTSFPHFLSFLVITLFFAVFRVHTPLAPQCNLTCTRICFQSISRTLSHDPVAQPSGVKQKRHTLRTVTQSPHTLVTW